MPYWKEKRRGKKKYYYLTRSVRLPNGRVKTIQRLADPKERTGKYKDWFIEQEKRVLGDWAAKQYHADGVFTEDEIRKIESIRADYKRILSKLSKPQRKDLFDRFTVNFTYESNAIEGNSLTLKDVRIVLFEKTMIKGKELREIYETINSRKVVDWILRKKFKVAEKDLIRMHKMLVQNMEIATGYKKIPNFLLDRNVKTAPPERVAAEMEKLVRFYEGSKKTMHPLQLAARFHGMFEKIHPFDDGNGRVGRFLANVALANQGYPPIIIRKTQRIAYFKALEDFDNGYTENLERFMLERFKQTYRKFFEMSAKYAK